MPKSVTEQMEAIFNRYPDQVNEVVEEEAKRAAESTAARLKSTSPRRPTGGKYARGWKVSKSRESRGYVVHNREYQLTHLLENGHVSRNQYGTYRRVPAKVHIKPAEDAGIMQFELALRAKIGRIT